MKSFFISLLLLFGGTLQMFAQDSLPDLKSLDELQKHFTANAGKVRLVSLLSPT